MANDDRPAKTAGIDHDAEIAVHDAMAALVVNGERAHSLTVPMAAEGILISRGAGKVTRGDAGERIRNAIRAMVERGELEAPTERAKDWKLLK